MSVTRVLRTILASLYLLVGMSFGMAAGQTRDHHTATVAIDCADPVGGMAGGHHAAKPPCAPTGKLADHRHCPNCPVGGSCSDTPPAAMIAASVLVSLRSANPPVSRATTDPTGRNPLPDPRPPRAVV